MKNQNENIKYKITTCGASIPQTSKLNISAKSTEDAIGQFMNDVIKQTFARPMVIYGYDENKIVSITKTYAGSNEYESLDKTKDYKVGQELDEKDLFFLFTTHGYDL